MTYQEKIEALHGTIYDYDDVCDNRPSYFDYDDPYDYEELYGWDDPVEDGTCYDPYRSDVAGGVTIYSRAWFGDKSDGDIVFAPELTVTEVGDRSPSETPDLVGGLGGKTEATFSPRARGVLLMF